MLYSGQEFGEKGMDKEGFSGRDGRTTIFDYWSPETLTHAYQENAEDVYTQEQKYLAATYRQLLRLANEEKAIREGETFDLMYVNPWSEGFDPRTNFAFLRKKDDEVMLIVLNSLKRLVCCRFAFLVTPSISSKSRKKRFLSQNCSLVVRRR